MKRPQDTANKMRTAALWGMRTRDRLMHDGLSTSRTDAIERHNGEGTDAPKEIRVSLRSAAKPTDHFSEFAVVEAKRISVAPCRLSRANLVLAGGGGNALTSSFFIRWDKLRIAQTL